MRHLLTNDVTKRYGCMKSGVKDIIDHRFFRDFDWRGLLYMNLEPPYIPKIKDEMDTSNFSEYPDSGSDIQPLRPEKDPFINW